MPDYIEICRDLVISSINTEEYAVFLFGSRAFESHPGKADIDIGIIGKKQFPLQQKYRIKEKLEDADIPYNVDIIDFYGTDEKFRITALKKIKIWSRPPHIDPGLKL